MSSGVPTSVTTEIRIKRPSSLRTHPVRTRKSGAPNEEAVVGSMRETMANSAHLCTKRTARTHFTLVRTH